MKERDREKERGPLGVKVSTAGSKGTQVLISEEGSERMDQVK